MRKMLIIIVSVVISILNITSINDSSTSELKVKSNVEIKIEKSINWGLGSKFFKLVHFAELMLVSKISRNSINF